MSRITHIFSRQWRNINFALIIILTIVLVIGRSNITPTVNRVLLSIFYSPFAELKNSLVELHDVALKNRGLAERVAETSLNLMMFEEADRENIRLRSVLGFNPPIGYTLLPVEVVSISGDYVPMSAVIKLGPTFSVFDDQPVINQQGLVGRISSISGDYATVQLLTDPSNHVAARLAVSREMGIIKYTVSDGMILDNFPILGNVEVGDTILSSGLGGVFPAGLTVGFVKDVFRPENEPFCRIKVEPAVNFFSIDEMFILKEQNQ